MPVLKERLKESDGGKKKRRRANKRAARESDLTELTKKELYERARKMDIDGRSYMTRKEVVQAITRTT